MQYFSNLDIRGFEIKYDIGDIYLKCGSKLIHTASTGDTLAILHYKKELEGLFKDLEIEFDYISHFGFDYNIPENIGEVQALKIFNDFKKIFDLKYTDFEKSRYIIKKLNYDNAFIIIIEILFDEIRKTLKSSKFKFDVNLKNLDLDTKQTKILEALLHIFKN